MKTSLGTILVIGLAGLQLMAVLLIISTSYVTSERALIGHARDLLSDVGTNTIEHSKGFLQPAHGAAELAANLAQNDVVASDNPQLLEQLFFQQLQLSPQFSGIFYGNRAGEFVYVMRSDDAGPYRSKFVSFDGDVRDTQLIWRDEEFSVVSRRSDPTDTYDPRTRPWYLRAEADQNTIWTDPYIFYSSQQPGITLASPVFGSDGTINGVMGVDIEISDISDFLSMLRVGSTGKALIIHRNGDVIAHPDQQFIRTPGPDGTLRFAKIWELEDPIARSAFSPLYREGALFTPQEMSSQFTHDGETYVSVVKPIISRELPWTIAVYAPENDFTAVIKRNRLNNIWIAIAVSAITALIGLLMANYIYRPVRAFAVRSALISQGELDPSEPLPKTYKELERANATLMQQIAARKQTEFEYGQTFDMASRPIAHLAPETGAVLRANPKFCELTGYTPQELSELCLADIALDGPAETFAHLDAAQSDTPPANQEMRLIRKGGRRLWVKFNAFMVRDEGGKALYAVAMVDDITGAIAKERQIQQLSRELSHFSRGHMMGQLASGLAHELNQPLAAIAQNADAARLAAERAGEADAELRTILQEIEEQSLRAGDIIRALRSFVKKDTAERTVFDFPELIEQARRLVLPEATEAEVDVRIEVEGQTEVYGNRTQIAQVIVNLLRNAVEALGGVDQEARRVVVRAARDGDKVHVSVTDNGPGIAPGLTLFSEFETTKPDGMGLGLSICRSIVAANGGRLWHDASHADGARFCFVLPASRAGSAARGSRAA
ncbi:histidine kinase [Pseudooceanicola lipolyticus]|uniref:histidine kinase n=1 Tax=Pseudooceanicola lipolyticus TaxID=2029104 RepID=A0A2M8IWN9_9RHOB|nr:cache domain-containing protein [Pseudooceanicola lipolyticus]PJE34947.1 histidine kinase [Pseudooceanicola lipolyticus]